MAVEAKIIDHIRTVLEAFGTTYLTENGALKKNKLINDLDKYNKELMTALLADNFIRKTYTEKIADVEVFKVNQFVEMLEYKSYWEDSYTKYSNKIGLTAGGKFIDEATDVVLDFPYKDTVLKAGMTKEDLDKTDDADEPFLNEVLAKAEIDELLEPKVLVNAKRYDVNGVADATSINDTDNLIIKGNNLLALHSLKERYAGKVKLIYLDPPYNTGSDSFEYNDRFNHATWLSFMKSRLEIARYLLADDGLIFIHLDYNEDAYAKILLDNIFSRESYVSTISVKSNSLSGNKTQHKNRTILKNKDSIIVFVKNKNNLSINPQYEAKDRWDTHYNQILLGDDKNGFVVKKLKDVLSQQGILDSGRITPESWNNPKFRKYVIKNSERVFQIVNSIPKDLKKASKQSPDEVVYKMDKSGDRIYALNGKRLSMLSKTFHLINGEKVPAQLLGDLWTDIDFQNTQNQGGISFTNAKKPEQLLSRIISMSTEDNDLIVDFFMGSATTQAVAMKMNRRFIGIEQMDYINSVAVPRLQKVIEGEQGGISKVVNWQGGGSFVYAELMEKNQGYLKDLQKAETMAELMVVYTRMKSNADIDFRVDLAKFEEEIEKFNSLDDRKRELIRILDKNQLYYNYGNIDDENVRDLITDTDYQFNKAFYKKDGE
ncbi:site-specific DNA-methyltransferase [Ligilactobacillus saerimneri]|uniref:site-specific DNA-methyltransferase n=1 Tax=Ligilactobacillus saerimneri TaxID=228229 RepID=UPI0024BA2AED|nr:site-specific DNA-methyltransferase [Ligilactobacillus saerimneri]